MVIFVQRPARLLNWIFTPSIQKNQSGVLPDIGVLSVLTFGLKYKIKASGILLRLRAFDVIVVDTVERVPFRLRVAAGRIAKLVFL